MRKAIIPDQERLRMGQRVRGVPDVSFWTLKLFKFRSNVTGNFIQTLHIYQEKICFTFITLAEGRTYFDSERVWKLKIFILLIEKHDICFIAIYSLI